MSGAGGREWRMGARLLLVLAVGILLGRLGPFGTFGELQTAERYAYWIGLTLLMWVQGAAILALIERPLAERAWPRWGRAGLAALLAAVPTAFEVAWAEMLLRVERDLGPVDLLAIMGDVALLSVPLLLLTHGLPHSTMAQEPAVTSEDPGTGPLLALMASAKRGPLLAVGSEDHYLRLYTERGEQLIAMRFADAIARLTGVQGMQVHRSWWVAEQAVDSISRAGDGLQLTLRNGLTVPVSRSYAQQVRKAWADRIR